MTGISLVPAACAIIFSLCALYLWRIYRRRLRYVKTRLNEASITIYVTADDQSHADNARPTDAGIWLRRTLLYTAQYRHAIIPECDHLCDYDGGGRVFSQKWTHVDWTGGGRESFTDTINKSTLHNSDCFFFVSSCEWLHHETDFKKKLCCVILIQLHVKHAYCIQCCFVRASGLHYTKAHGVYFILESIAIKPPAKLSL